MVGEAEHSWQGGVQGRQTEPSNQWVARQERQFQAAVRQVTQGEAQLGQAEPSKKVPEAHAMHVLLVVRSKEGRQLRQ